MSRPVGPLQFTEGTVLFRKPEFSQSAVLSALQACCWGWFCFSYREQAGAPRPHCARTPCPRSWHRERSWPALLPRIAVRGAPRQSPLRAAALRNPIPCQKPWTISFGNNAESEEGLSQICHRLLRTFAALFPALSAL